MFVGRYVYFNLTTTTHSLLYDIHFVLYIILYPTRYKQTSHTFEDYLKYILDIFNLITIVHSIFNLSNLLDVSNCFKYISLLLVHNS